MKPTDRRIQAGAELYYAAGGEWRVVSPKKATVVDPGPHRIVRQRQGAIYLVSWHRDDTGNAVLVDLDEGSRVRRCAVPARDLRGLWRETLTATGRTLAGVKAHDAALSALADGPITVDGLLRLAAINEGVDDGVFAVLAQAIDPKEQQ